MMQTSNNIIIIIKFVHSAYMREPCPVPCTNSLLSIMIHIDSTHIHVSHVQSNPLKDPPRKGHCILNLSIEDTVSGPKNYHSLLIIENLREEDNLYY